MAWKLLIPEDDVAYPPVLRISLVIGRSWGQRSRRRFASASSAMKRCPPLSIAESPADSASHAVSLDKSTLRYA